MKTTKRYLARLLAVLAIAAAVVAVIVIVSNADLDDSGEKTRGTGKAHPAKQKQKQNRPQRSKAKAYTVQSGDTLIAIAHKTGVPVAELQALNPEIDPQILIAGQVLKLR